MTKSFSYNIHLELSTNKVFKVIKQNLHNKVTGFIMQKQIIHRL